MFRLEDAYRRVGRTAFLSARGVSATSARSRKPASFPVRGGDRGRRGADSGRLAPMRPGLGVMCIGILSYSSRFVCATDRIDFALAPEGWQRCRTANASTTMRAKRFHTLFSATRSLYSDTDGGFPPFIFTLAAFRVAYTACHRRGGCFLEPVFLVSFCITICKDPRKCSNHTDV